MSIEPVWRKWPWLPQWIVRDATMVLFGFLAAAGFLASGFGAVVDWPFAVFAVSYVAWARTRFGAWGAEWTVLLVLVLFVVLYELNAWHEPGRRIYEDAGWCFASIRFEELRCENGALWGFEGEA